MVIIIGAIGLTYEVDNTPRHNTPVVQPGSVDWAKAHGMVCWVERDDGQVGPTRDGDKLEELCGAPSKVNWTYFQNWAN